MTMQREYEQADAATSDEVLVEITEDAEGDQLATVAWSDWISDGVTRHGDMVGPMGVGEALFKADEVAELYGFERVVVSLPGAEQWNPAWGTLHRRMSDTSPATDDDVYEADDGDEGRASFTDVPDDDDGATTGRQDRPGRPG